MTFLKVTIFILFSSIDQQFLSEDEKVGRIGSDDETDKEEEEELSLVQELNSAWEQKKSEIATIRENEFISLNNNSSSSNNNSNARKHSQESNASSSSTSSSMSSSLPPYSFGLTSTSLLLQHQHQHLHHQHQQDSGFESSSEVVTTSIGNYENVSPTTTADYENLRLASCATKDKSVNLTATTTNVRKTLQSVDSKLSKRNTRVESLEEEEEEEESLKDLSRRQEGTSHGRRRKEEDLHDYQNIDVVSRCVDNNNSSNKNHNKNALKTAKSATAVHHNKGGGGGEPKVLKKRTTSSSNSTSLYQNVDFARANRSLLMLSDRTPTSTSTSTRRKSSSTSSNPACQKQTVRNAANKQKASSTYENCEFATERRTGGERAVYQNVPNRKTNRSKSVGVLRADLASKPARKTSEVVVQQSDNNDDEVYAQVRFLRRQVQEVNAMLEEKGGDCNRSSIKRRSKSHSNSRAPNLAPDSRTRSSGAVIPVVPRPNAAQNRKTYLPNLSKTVEAVEKNIVVDEESNLRKNSCLTSSERRRAHFRALLNRFDSSPDNVGSVVSGDGSRKASLPVSVGEGRNRSSSLITKQRLSVSGRQ